MDTVTTEFSPTQDPSALNWWDCSDTATISDTGGLVDQINDKIGSDHLTATLGDRPTTNSRTLNSLNVLDFDSSNMLNKTAFAPASTFAFYGVWIIDSVSNSNDSLMAFDATNDFQIDALSGSQWNGAFDAAGMSSDITFTGGPYSGALQFGAVLDFGSNAINCYIDGLVGR